MKEESELREKHRKLQASVKRVEEKAESPDKEEPTRHERVLQRKARQQLAMLDWVLDDG